MVESNFSTARLQRALTYQDIPVWRHAVIIRWAVQICSAVLVVTVVSWFFLNVSSAIQERQIPFGFSFLSREYQTPIGIHFIPYESSNSFLYAMGVAFTNTLIVSVLGVILATVLGTAIGIARLSGSWIVSKLALAYVEFFRNVPLLVQLLFWFYIMLALPAVREGHVIAGLIFVNNDGISMPWALATGLWAALAWLGLTAVGVLAGIGVHTLLERREVETGRASYPIVSASAVVLLIAGAAWLVVSSVAGEAPFVLSTPESAGAFGRIAGGYTIRAGLLVLLVGLVMYTAAFIAEIVRAGIQSVSRGQIEAARATGLSPIDVLRHVTFPQALRVIIPPLISQFLNLTKNSSLGGAVGYTELTNVAITMTQTAPAVSLFLLLMLCYLAMSLTWSLIGNVYNQRMSFAGR